MSLEIVLACVLTNLILAAIAAVRRRLTRPPTMFERLVRQYNLDRR